MTDEKAQISALIAEDPYTFMYVGDAHEGFNVVDRIEGDNRRWSRAIHVIITSSSGRFYEWTYDSGLTERQDDEYDPENIREVTRREEQVIKVHWDPIKVSKPDAGPTGAALDPW